MHLTRKTELLKRLLPRVAPSAMIENRGAGLESLGLPEAQIEAAATGIERLEANQVLESAQASALEAIIHRQFRPAVFVIHDTYDVPPAPWQKLAEPESRKRICNAIVSIGRIELPGMTRIPFGGTGFVVGPGLVMTNRHVAEIFARGLGQRGLAFKPNRASAINFRREVIPSPEVENLAVREVVMMHPYWDMALLRVEGLSPQQSALTLAAPHPDDLAGREVVVIGYPAQDLRNELELQNQIFGGVFDVKRLQPGILRERRQIVSFENRVNALTHDASTLGGNSGSAVVDVQSGQVVALHFAGLYLDANFAVPGFELARDRRVVDAGVQFSASLPPTTDWEDRWRIAEIPAEAIRVAGPSPLPGPPPQRPSPAIEIQEHSVTWTIPLRVTISLGNPQFSAMPSVSPLPPQAAPQEGLFSESESEIVGKAYHRFSAGSLNGTDFSWPAAVSAGAASHLAYADALRVNEVCRTQWGFDNCQFIHRNDTECFVASTDQEVLLAFRGTAGVADWIRDLTVFSTVVSYGSVHEGFYLGMKQVKREIAAALDRFGARDKNLVLTGHSLGGALATIAAAELDDQYPIASIYTFGQPAVGKQDFRTFMQRFSSRLYRIVNDDDVITMVPPGYVHVGQLYRFGFLGGVSHEGVAAAASAAADAEIQTMSEREFCALQEQCAMASQDGSAASGVEGLLPGPSFLDHKIWRYLKKALRQLG
jgi:endonuclease G